MGQPQPHVPQVDTGAFLAAFIPFLIVLLALSIVQIIAMWRILTKAGQPGWAAIVPFYGTYVLLKTVGRPGWWLVMFFLPIANIVFLVLVMVDLAKAFGKSGGFAALLIFLPFVGMPMLAFSDNAVYRGPVADPNFAAWQNSQYNQYYGHPQGWPQQPQPGYQQYPPQYPQQGHPPQQGPWQ